MIYPIQVRHIYFFFDHYDRNGSVYFTVNSRYKEYDKTLNFRTINIKIIRMMMTVMKRIKQITIMILMKIVTIVIIKNND